MPQAECPPAAERRLEATQEWSRLFLVPGNAHYRGTGDPEDAASFECR